MTDLLTSIQAALDLPPTPLSVTEAGTLPSTFAVTELASASIGAAGQAIAQLILQQTGRLPSVSVDRRLASFWFSSSIRPQGWQKLLYAGVEFTEGVGPKAKASFRFSQLFPELVQKNVSHDGIIDASLIAEYGRRFLNLN